MLKLNLFFTIRSSFFIFLFSSNVPLVFLIVLLFFFLCFLANMLNSFCRRCKCVYVFSMKCVYCIYFCVCHYVRVSVLQITSITRRPKINNTFLFISLQFQILIMVYGVFSAFVLDWNLYFCLIFVLTQYQFFFQIIYLMMGFTPRLMAVPSLTSS